MNELDYAIDLLKRCAETCEQNAEIIGSSLSIGSDPSEWQLQKELARSYRAAEQHLKAVNG